MKKIKKHISKNAGRLKYLNRLLKGTFGTALKARRKRMSKSTHRRTTIDALGWNCFKIRQQPSIAMEIQMLVALNQPLPYPPGWTGESDTRTSSRRTIVRRVTDDPSFPSLAFHNCRNGFPDGFEQTHLTFQSGDVVPENTASSLQATIDAFSAKHSSDTDQLNFYQLIRFASYNNPSMTPFDDCFKEATPEQLGEQKEREEAWSKRNKEAKKADNGSTIGLKQEDFTYDQALESLLRAKALTDNIKEKFVEADKKGRKKAIVRSKTQSKGKNMSFRSQLICPKTNEGIFQKNR